MTPKKTAKARKVISRRWYYPFREWQMKKMRHHWEAVLDRSRKEDVMYSIAMIAFYARKEGWYINKRRARWQRKRDSTSYSK